MDMNVFNRQSPIMQGIGYEPKTTFWSDFSIADAFGVAAVQDTYDRAFEAWKDDAEYMAELVMVLNHKIWQHYEHNEPLAKLYNSLWEQADIACIENFKGNELRRYYEITD